MTSITIPNSVTSVGKCAFDGCKSLTSIEIPNSVTSVGNYAFSSCSNLDNIIYPSGLDVSGASIHYNTSKVEYSVTDDGVTITNITLGKDKTNVEIPDSINGKNVTEVDKSVRDKVSESGHTHTGGTSTCKQKAICSICGNEYGELIHNLPKTDAAQPTCTENGNTAYWYCSDCNKYFSDKDCKNEIALADTVISAKGHTLTATAEKAPTCTEDGNIKYWYCTECNKCFSDENGETEISLEDTVINAGHTITVAERKEPTCTEDGNIEYRYCTECNKYFSDEECKNEITFADTVINTNGHNYVDGKCKECGAFENGIGEHLEGYSLSLDGNIGVNFYMELDESVIADENAYMQFTLPDGEVTNVSISDAKQQTVNENTYYVFSCEIAAKEMNDTITAQIITSDNEGEKYIYSVEDYIQYIRENSTGFDEKTLSLVEAMEEYGIYAEAYFNNEKVNASPEMDAVTADTLAGHEKQTSGELPEGITYYGSSLLLESNTTMRHYFKAVDGTDVSEYGFIEKDGYYYKEISDISAGKLGTAQNIAVGDYTISYSPMSYAYSVLNNDSTDESLKDLVKALYLYKQAAEAYQQ